MFQLDPRKHCLGYVKTEIALSYIPQMISSTIQNCHEDLKTQSSMYTKKSLSDTDWKYDPSPLLFYTFVPCPGVSADTNHIYSS